MANSGSQLDLREWWHKYAMLEYWPALVKMA